MIRVFQSVFVTAHGSPAGALPLSASEDQSRASRLPIALLLAVGWLTVAILRFSLAMFVSNPSIFGDELIYWSMASSFHHGLHFVAFNLHVDIPTQLYPILLSPLFAAGDATVVYPLVKLVSCLMFCSVIFPAYLLARELLGREESLLVALLSLLVPGGAYTATVMAENLYYPLFVLSAWLAYRTLYRGTARDALFCGLAFTATYYAKPHVLFLMVAYGISVLIWSLTAILGASAEKDRVQHTLAGLLCRSLPFVIFACGLGIRLWELTGRSYSWSDVIFGQFYAGALHVSKFSLPLGAFLVSGAWLFVVLTMSTAWVPVLAMIASAAYWKRFNHTERWFWILSSCTAIVFLVMITRFSVQNDNSLRSYERYVFQLAPLLFTWYFVSRRFLSSRWLVLIGVVFVSFIAVKLVRSPHALTWSSFSDAPTFTGPFWVQLRNPNSVFPLFTAIFLGGLLCLLASAGRNQRWKLLFGWSIFLIFCNIGWYGFQFTVVQRDVKRFTEFAMNLKATIPAVDTIGFLQDQADIRTAWYPNFWLRQPIYYFSEKEHEYWYVDPITSSADGALNFGTQRPQLLLASDSLALPYPKSREFPELHLRLYQIPPAPEIKSPQ